MVRVREFSYPEDRIQERIVAVPEVLSIPGDLVDDIVARPEVADDVTSLDISELCRSRHR